MGIMFVTIKAAVNILVFIGYCVMPCEGLLVPKRSCNRIYNLFNERWVWVVLQDNAHQYFYASQKVKANISQCHQGWDQKHCPEACDERQPMSSQLYSYMFSIILHTNIAYATCNFTVKCKLNHLQITCLKHFKVPVRNQIKFGLIWHVE